ncbi:uncharacterized protein LOC123552302 [Mercenaria mercenaria]|uniref:uncharacterized protein LOC123552302 n=1 Tax=Mercenaria mercenaria TaxID=6596 RepID=UPI001E1DDA7E|nr:uncharacterized protein LOC123552302 [Mercenaria mercenaria]
MGGKLNIDDILFITRAVSVAYGLSAVACTGAGIFTLWYAAPDIKFPFSSASGVWTGIFSFVIFVLGNKTVKGYNIDYPSSSKRKVIAFYTFVIMDITFGILHVTFSAQGFSYCNTEMRIGGLYCNAEERPRLLLMEGFNIAFGVIITLLSVAVTIYLSLRRKINILAGIPTDSRSVSDYVTP